MSTLIVGPAWGSAQGGRFYRPCRWASVSTELGEIGVRVALGATRADVLALVLRAGLRLALPGLLIGGGIAIGASHLIRAGLPGASPVDPQVLGTVSLLFLFLVIVAYVGPARHASAIEPSVALRAE